jgi:hypothetical protein
MTLSVRWAITIAVIFVVTESLFAQAPPNPQAPTIGFPQPSGGQRGSVIDLSLSGTNLAGPTSLWTSFPAKITIPSDQNNGKDETKLRVRIEVARDAPLGFGAIRLATTRGISNLRLFCIDDLPPFLASGSHHSKETAQTIPVPCVVSGHAQPEKSDFFRFNAKAGQRLSFETLGRRLGNSLDPQITLHDGRTGHELPGGHSNDAPGLQTDARLTYTFPSDGEYLIELRDVAYRGGPEYGYRLRVGDFPCATTPLPMAARRGSQLMVNFAGSYVDGVAPVEVLAPADPALDTIYVAPRGPSGLYGWPVGLALSDHDELLEQEPNNLPAQANRIPIPCGVTGRFEKHGDIDQFVFKCGKGQRLIIEGQTLELNSPTEIYMTLRDSKGTQLAVSNPMASPRIDFTAPADGDCTLAVEHLLYAGGPSETYHLTITPFKPGFEISLGNDRIDIPAGSWLPLQVFAARQDYGGPIDVRVTGDSGLFGRGMIYAGQPPAPDKPATTLFLHAPADTVPGAYELVIESSAWIDGKRETRRAVVRASVGQELAGLPYPPRNLLDRASVAITPRAPFELSARLDREATCPGSPMNITLSAKRMPGFSGEIVVTPVNWPANVTPALANIPAGKDSATIALQPAANAPMGHFEISLAGKAKHENREQSVTAAPVALKIEVPFELKVEPAKLTVNAGSKIKVAVTATRGGGYRGPIALEWRNLPPQVTVSKGTIAEGQSAVEIELAASISQAPIVKSDVQIVGTATSLNNQQHSSPAVQVEVRKK